MDNQHLFCLFCRIPTAVVKDHNRTVRARLQLSKAIHRLLIGLRRTKYMSTLKLTLKTTPQNTQLVYCIWSVIWRVCCGGASAEQSKSKKKLCVKQVQHPNTHTQTYPPSSTSQKPKFIDTNTQTHTGERRPVEPQTPQTFKTLFRPQIVPHKKKQQQHVLADWEIDWTMLEGWQKGIFLKN